MQGRDAEPAVAGALVVLPHREGRSSQCLRLFLLQGLAFELLGELGGDHLEQVSPEGTQVLGVMVRSQLDQMDLSGRALLAADGELAAAGSRSSAAMIARAWATLTWPRPMASDRASWPSSLGQTQVGPGVATYLPGLDGQPVRGRRRA